MNRRSKQKDYARRAQSREYSDRKDNRQPNTPSNSGGTALKPSVANEFRGERNGDNVGWNRFKRAQLAKMPETLPKNPEKRHISVFVEGYEDISFWRGIFDLYESDSRSFEIGVPPREDLAKGKKVVMMMLPNSSPNKLLCVDSDFDFLFGNKTEQSKIVNNSDYIFHTYAYSAENFLCYAPSLHNVCVKATKNDTRIFDFERFLSDYSQIIYPVFLWYAYSGQQVGTAKIFTLLDFKTSVKLNYLEVEDNGEQTLKWLSRQIDKRIQILERNNPGWSRKVGSFGRYLTTRGVTPESTYLFMQGHTLMDNVVMVMLNAVCEKLKLMSNIRISTSTKTGTALKNEMSNYNNSLRGVRDVLLDNEAYKDCHLYRKLKGDIERYIAKL